MCQEVGRIEQGCKIMCVQDSMAVHEGVRPKLGKDQSMSEIHSLRYNSWGLSLSSLSCLLANLSTDSQGSGSQLCLLPSFMMSPGPERTDFWVECWELTQVVGHPEHPQKNFPNLSQKNRSSMLINRPVSTSAHSQATPGFISRTFWRCLHCLDGL